MFAILRNCKLSLNCKHERSQQSSWRCPIKKSYRFRLRAIAQKYVFHQSGVKLNIYSKLCAKQFHITSKTVFAHVCSDTKTVQSYNRIYAFTLFKPLVNLSSLLIWYLKNQVYSMRNNLDFIHCKQYETPSWWSECYPCYSILTESLAAWSDSLSLSYDITRCILSPRLGGLSRPPRGSKPDESWGVRKIAGGVEPPQPPRQFGHWLTLKK